MRHLLIYIFLALTLPLCAAVINVQGPTSAAVGDIFQVRYTVKTTDVENFRLNIPQAFDLIYGPSQSTQQSFSIINGHTTKSASVTFTYNIKALRTGTHTIPSAHATVDGHGATSPALRINVTAGAGGQQSQPQQRIDNAGTRIGGADLFIRVQANKNTVYEQEPVLLTYKVYTLVELTQLEGKMPDLNGFHTQEIPLPQQKTFHIERVGGRQYRCVTWSQYVMYPQLTGHLTIPPLTFKGIVVQQRHDVDPFEAFFNGGSGYVEVKKDIQASGANINVLPLPDKPKDFSGGVGTFTIQTKADKTNVRAGDPVNLRITVSGNGNLKLIRQPQLTLPADFDQYDPKQTDRTHLTTSGLTGAMQYDYLIVPRNKGQYTIPAVAFTFFNTATRSYQTVRTAPIALTVTKGNGSSNAAADYSTQADTDIHDIQTSHSPRQTEQPTLFGTATYWALNGGILAAFVALLVIFRKRAAALADITTRRANRASRQATKRLRKAKRLMAAGGDPFYDEVLRALWGYVSDKLTIPVEQLSRDNITERLQQRGTSQETIATFIAALDDCEFARYAPADPATTMQNTYQHAATAITNIENEKPHKHATPHTPHAIVLLLVLSAWASVAQASACGVSRASARSKVAQASARSNIKANADAAYRIGDYQQAITLYRQDLNDGPTPETYYNLGNAYYRTNDITHALLCYYRAERLAPLDADIEHNIDIARSKTQDRMPARPQVFLVTWYNALALVTTADTWAAIAIAALAAALILLLVYLFATPTWLRRTAFYTAAPLILLFLAANILAYSAHHIVTTHDTAIITAPETILRTAPDNRATPAATLHQGTTITLTDAPLQGWQPATLPDGREGWIQTKAIEQI